LESILARVALAGTNMIEVANRRGFGSEVFLVGVSRMT
jgi:hypothetical protein